jgi:hypothetical protein
MITNNGITLLGKYLVGQTPAFASHIAIGCGPNVLGSDESLSTAATSGGYATKNSLDFEMDRFPIISRTTNVIDGEQQIIFTAEIPSADRYGITEVGVFPAQSNNVVGSIPSQTLFSFTTNEVWQKSLSATVTDVEVESDIVDDSQNIDTTTKAFFLASDNAIFVSSTRLKRMEQPRFLNSSLVLRGDLTALSTGELNTSTGDYVVISQPTLPELDTANEFSDKIKVAFSVISKNLAATSAPTTIKINIVFRTDAGVTATYAYDTDDYVYANPITQNDRYTTDEVTLTNIAKSSSTFAWKDVTSVRIYANANTSSDFYIAMDGIKFENLSSIDDRFALVGYTALKSSDTVAAEYPRPLEKPEGTMTYVEFRFALDVS